jgi:hypothetical protein
MKFSAISKLVLSGSVLFLLGLPATTAAFPPNPTSWSSPFESHFDYWNRCSNLRLEPERRIGYCRSMLGRGHGDDGNALSQIGSAYIEEHKYDAAVDALTSGLRYFRPDAFPDTIGF